MTNTLTRMFASLLIALAAVSAVAVEKPLKELSKGPPMGWNSWNWFGKRSINEKIVEEVIDAVASSGLKDAGYTYVVVDGGWRDTKLGSDGELVSHPVKFPRGMKRLADHAHSKGLKFGLHTVPGTHDCGGDAVGGFGHEETHIKQFTEWGIDFLKVDKCFYRGDKKGWTEPLLKETYAKWRKLIDESDRDIALSICAYEYRDWYPKTCQMARTTYDLRTKVHGSAVFSKGKLSVLGVAETNNKCADFAGNGYWNDPDIMAIGKQGLTEDEQKVHFALWCVMSAPLMLGNDPRNMSEQEKELILNRECIAIDQDPTEQGRKIKVDGDVDIWAKKLGDGSVAVLFINRHDTEAKSVTIPAKELGLSGKIQARDVYAKEDVGAVGAVEELVAKTPPRACRFLKLTPQATK
jgi:alpha-galactosidase